MLWFKSKSGRLFYCWPPTLSSRCTFLMSQWSHVVNTNKWLSVFSLVTHGHKYGSHIIDTGSMWDLFQLFAKPTFDQMTTLVLKCAIILLKHLLQPSVFFKWMPYSEHLHIFPMIRSSSSTLYIPRRSKSPAPRANILLLQSMRTRNDTQLPTFNGLYNIKIEKCNQFKGIVDKWMLSEPCCVHVAAAWLVSRYTVMLM